MSKELVTQDNQAVAKYERYDVAGADTLDRSDIVLPRVRVRQPTSKFGAPQDAGKFHNNLTEQFSDTLTAVILRVSKGRVMWPTDFSGDNEPLCASDNAIMPRLEGGLADPLPGPCATCPMALWGDDHEPPRCSLVYTYLCADCAEDDMPFLISAMRTSVKAAKKLNSLIKMFGIRKSMTIKTALVTGDQGQWYELLFQVAATLSAEAIQRYASIARAMAEVEMTVDTENTAGGIDDLDDDDYAPSSAAQSKEFDAF